MSDAATQLYHQHAEGHSKFVYFLIGAAGSAIAFALHQTSGEPLSPLHAPIGVAVALWAGSFASGLSGLSIRQNIVRMNADLLNMADGTIPPYLRDAPLGPQLALVREVLEEESKKTGRKWRLQQWLLFAGGLFYIAGHVLKMASLSG